ncbi:MAG: hypothetical protein OXI53_01650 [Nitrospira sp.]|nr:hypothetical protein [Nitrospira sp.]MDE0404001.1 hypothetical protein [Nitrospira sp.]MDE0485715.1 hypothetical protein [Nitrospira sp.]
MPQESSQPWIGYHYDCSETRLLLLADQLPALPTILVKKVLADFENADDFMKKLSQGLAGEKEPAKERLHHVWHRVAFTYYVGETKSDFCSNILNKLRPRRIIVIRKTLWSKMPKPADVYMTDDVQGYLFDEDRSVAVCLAHPYPGWDRLADTIYFALGGELPRNGRCPVGGE